MLVLIGTSHPLVERLSENRKWDKPSLEPGEGLIQVVRKAFGEKSALIVTGGDAAGVDRATRQLAEKFPHIWARGKDRTTLEDVEEDMRKFVAGRSPAGQAAMSLYKFDTIARQLAAKIFRRPASNVRRKGRRRIRDVVRQRQRRHSGGPISPDVQSLDVQKGRRLVNEDFEIASEVDEFWTKLRKRVIPA